MCENTIRAGYARVDITPTVSVPLAGIGNTSKRMSTSVRDPLYTTCLAFTDAEDHTVLLYTSDLIRSCGDVTERIRAAIREKLGIDEDCVMVSGTHTHSGPDLLNKV